MDEIREMEAPGEERTLTDEEKRFVVDDDQKAEWCLEKIRQSRAEIDKWTKFYGEQLKRVTDKEEARIAYMECLLNRYFNSIPHKETKTQASYQLPSGKMVLRKASQDYERNDELVIAWLKDNDEARFIRIKETLDWSELKKTLTVVGEEVANESGEIIPGISVVIKPESFKVEVK